MTDHTSPTPPDSVSIAQKLRALAIDETEYRCTNGHDRCGFPDSDCPYCDRSISSSGELFENAADLIDRLRSELSAARATPPAQVREALKSIWQYGSDTLSGRVDGGLDDRDWQRAAVVEMVRRAEAALSASAPATDEKRGAIFKHKRRGTEYEIVGRARVQASVLSIHENDELEIYRAVSDGALWARPVDEFYDGRFELVSPSKPDATGEKKP